MYKRQLPIKAAGLLKTLRCANGGYSLAKSPSQIRLSEIIRVLEGSIAPVECVDDLNMCNRAPHCASRDMGKEIKETMENISESITLQDLVERQKSKQQCQKTM